MCELAKMELRETNVITLVDAMQPILEPELLRLQLSKKIRKKPIDIGSLAYFVRGKNLNSHDDCGTPVVKSSFVESRRNLIMMLLESYAVMRESSILTWNYRSEYFIEWLNNNGYKEIFASDVYAQQAYRDFTSYLNHRIMVGEIKPLTASGYQDGAVNIIELLYPDTFHYILSGVVKILAPSGSATPSDAHVQLYKDVFLAIAQHCSDFVLNNSSYPCVVNIRDYEVVMFPSNHGAIGPFKIPPAIYNPVQRRVATPAEHMVAKKKLDRETVVKFDSNRAVLRAQENVNAANENNRHWHRLYLSALAAKAYAGLFLLITGASPTEFSQFTYKEAIEVEKSPLKKELKAIKFRAGGKTTLYNIGRHNGLPLLRQYLKLREWILNGKEVPNLFFAMTKGTQGNNGSFEEFSASSTMKKFHGSISGVFLDPKVPKLSSRKMRKHKSNVQHSARLSPSTVSKSLNHTEAVNLSTYAEATLEQQETEFSLFWQSVRHAADVVRERSETSSGDRISTAAGHCDDFNQPSALGGWGTSFIEPNCRTQYGCLYCSHYICHSDEEDLHKLFSLQYVIDSVRKINADVGHADALFKDLSIRINFIISAIGERSVSTLKLVEIVREKVYSYGILTPFWENRLSRYEQIGVVF
ncbi:hypothetical protein [Pseudomonas sp. O39]|uniref:hypothetical protein n=1 Tax=Pseudomonas sp. O39 TaxID=3379130 RepID=UPI00387AFCD5